MREDGELGGGECRARESHAPARFPGSGATRFEDVQFNSPRSFARPEFAEHEILGLLEGKAGDDHRSDRTLPRSRVLLAHRCRGDEEEESLAASAKTARGKPARGPLLIFTGGPRSR